MALIDLGRLPIVTKPTPFAIFEMETNEFTKIIDKFLSSFITNTEFYKFPSYIISIRKFLF